jgi:hypothetical protein
MSMFIDPVTGRPRQLELTRGQQPQAPEQDAGIFGQPAAAPTGFDAAFEAERRRLMGATPPAPEVPADDGTAFGRGLRRGIPQTLSTLAAGAGALGFEDVQQYLSGIATEQEMAILRENPELLQGVDFRDIRGLNSFLSYLGELAGEQAPLIGGTLLAGGATALAGASAPVAAVVGTVAASGPLLFGSNVQRRAEVLGINPEDLASEDVNRAALTAVGQTALEAATNVLLVGRLGAGAARQIVENASAEAIAEVGQQALERAQAGLDLDSPDAYEEYIQSAVAGATLGTAFGGVGALAGARGRGAARDEELNEDQTEEALQNTLEAQRAEEGRQKELQEQAVAPVAEEDLAAKFVSDLTGGAIALPAPQSRIAETDQNQLLKRIQREQAANFRRIRLSELPMEERLALAKAREAAGQPRRLTTTVPELQAVVGSEAAAREAAKQKPASAAAGQGVYTVPDNAKFNKDQIEAAIARVQATGQVNFPIVRKAIEDVTPRSKDGKRAKIPNEVTQSVLDELVNRNLIRRVEKGNRKTYEVEPLATQAQTPSAQARRELDRIDQLVKQAEQRREMLVQEKRRVDQTGKNLAGRKVQPSGVNRNLRLAERELSALQNRAELERQRIRFADPLAAIQQAERVQQRVTKGEARQEMARLQRELRQAKSRERELRKIVARAKDNATFEQQNLLNDASAQVNSLQVQRERLNARLRNPSAVVQVKPEETAAQQARVAAGFEAEAGAANTTPAYNAAYSGVLQNLRKRLDGMGLKDVALEFDERMLKEQGADGSYGNKLIKLASGIYDPDLTEQQLTDRMAAIMDHEVIHALRGMNLFSDGEWQSLSRAAAQQKYVAIKNGKATERAYTYLDRARKMYPDQSPEIQIEEAIAEMFRHHTGGTKRFTGRPGNLLQRIVNFFKSVFRANEASGFQRPSDIFERAVRGEIATRRPEPEVQAKERQSRRIRYSNPGGDWLARKQRNAELGMAEAQSGTSDAKGLFGPTTAYTSQEDGSIGAVTLPLDAVKDLQGANDEQPRPGQRKYDDLLESVRKNGFRNDNPIMIGVNHRGEAYITEGNNRVAIADRFNLPNIQAEVRWFNGGEEIGTDWSPESVMNMARGEDRQSRRVQLPENLAQFTVLDLYDGDGNFRDLADYTADGRRIARRKEDAIRMMQENRDRIFEQDNPQDIADLARIMAAEAEAALETDRNAIGWYGTTLEKAKDVLALLHPEIRSDEGANAAMDYAIAVTSNGMAVVDNFINANKQYENWQQTGRFLEEGYGNQGKSMVSAFQFYNALKDRNMTDADIAEFLSQETTPAQLRKNEVIQDLGITIASKEYANEPVRVSYIMGPKIGQGFYQNLRGNFDPLTMDRWWMRMFNRLTGRPFKEVNPELVQDNIDRVYRRLISNQITDNEARIRDLAMDSLGIDVLTPENVKDLGIEINRIYQRDFQKAPRDARPEKTELFAAADRLSQNAVDQLQEDPRTPADRKFMREVTNRARDVLRADSNTDITNADLQALLWYAEKRLWDAYGVRKGRGEDNDYVDGAIALLREKGFSDEQIAEALPDTDRYRLGAGIDTAGQNESVRGQPAEGSAAEETAQQRVEGERLSRRVMNSVVARMNEASGTNNMTAIEKQVTQYTDIADWLGKAVGVVVRRPGRAQEIADKFIQKTQDSFIPVARMIKELKDRGLTIMDTIDPYLQQQLSKSRAGGQIDARKRGIYRQAADAIKGLNVTEGMKQSLIDVSSANATRGYGLAKAYFDRLGSDKLAMADIFLYAQHALERNAYVRQIDPANQSGSGMSDAEAQAILDWFDNNLDAANRQAIDRVDAAIKNIVRDTNQVRIEAGLIPEDVMNVEYNKKGVRAPQFEHYVPLRGVFDDDASADYSDTVGGNKRLTVRGREDQRILGRGVDQYGTDILANLLFQNTNSIIRAENNKVAVSLADLLESNPELTQSYGRILDTLPQRRILNAYGSVQYTTDQRAKDRNDIVIAKRNGQEIIMEIPDENLAGAFNGKNVWNAGHANVILRGMAKVNRYLSNIVTSWNPEFVISNFSRDIQNAGINVSEFDLPGLRRDVVRNIPSAIAGLKRAIRDENYDSDWAKIYADFTRNGGQSAANPMNTLADQIDQVEALIKDFGEGGTLADLKRNGGKVLKFLEDYNTVVENAVRLTTYDALIKRGFSEARAAQAARGVTVDFTKTGDMGQFMNSMYLFYNAALQGSFFMFRAAARSKRVRRVLAGAIAMGFVSDFINSMVSGEDEAGTDEYDKIPDYILEHNWVIMLPEGLAPSGRRYVAIPMPYGLNFFYNTGRAISRAGRGGYEIDQAAKSITGTFLEVINPLGGTEHFLNFAAPTIADPFISLYGTNIDFTGRDIRREAFPGQQIARSHLYWNNTSPTAIQAAQALNGLTGGTETYGGWADISPNTLEFWFDYVTGGAGRFVQRTVELPVRVAEAQSNEDIIREVPLIRRMFGSISSREDLGSYIRARDRVLVPRNELRDAVDQGNRERIARLRQEYSPADFRLAEQINRIENQRRQITRRMNAVRDNPNISEERKRELLDRLDQQQQQIILRGLQLMRGQD